jgi:transcriptional regulator with XRE-family HTH domain
MEGSDDELKSFAMLRRRANVTQRKLAEALDMRQGTISDWERGVSIPHLPPSKYKLMMEVLKCSLDELIDAFEKKGG